MQSGRQSHPKRVVVADLQLVGRTAMINASKPLSRWLAWSRQLLSAAGTSTQPVGRRCMYGQRCDNHHRTLAACPKAWHMLLLPDAVRPRHYQGFESGPCSGDAALNQHWKPRLWWEAQPPHADQPPLQRSAAASEAKHYRWCCFADGNLRLPARATFQHQMRCSRYWRTCTHDRRCRRVQAFPSNESHRKASCAA